MADSDSDSLPPARVIASLQEALLRAALLGETLPGASRPLHLSDMQFILRHPHVYLADENLAGKISVEGLPKPLRVVSREELKELAEASGDVAYLHFRPAESVEGGVRLTLEGKLDTRDPGAHPLGLSSVQVKFRKAGGHWESFDDPVALAS